MDARRIKVGLSKKTEEALGMETGDKLRMWGPIQAVWDWFRSIFTGVEDKAKLVLEDLKPVIGDFVTQCAAIIEQVGETAFTDMITAAQRIAQAIESTMAGSTGEEKFVEFSKQLLEWAKAEGPTLLTLLEAGIGPILRVVLEMAIASAKGALAKGQA